MFRGKMFILAVERKEFIEARTKRKVVYYEVKALDSNNQCIVCIVSEGVHKKLLTMQLNNVTINLNAIEKSKGIKVRIKDVHNDE